MGQRLLIHRGFSRPSLVGWGVLSGAFCSRVRTRRGYSSEDDSREALLAQREEFALLEADVIPEGGPELGETLGALPALAMHESVEPSVIGARALGECGFTNRFERWQQELFFNREVGREPLIV